MINKPLPVILIHPNKSFFYIISQYVSEISEKGAVGEFTWIKNPLDNVSKYCPNDKKIILLLIAEPTTDQKSLLILLQHLKEYSDYIGLISSIPRKDLLLEITELVIIVDAPPISQNIELLIGYFSGNDRLRQMLHDSEEWAKSTKPM